MTLSINRSFGLIAGFIALFAVLLPQQNLQALTAWEQALNEERYMDALRLVDEQLSSEPLNPRLLFGKARCYYGLNRNIMAKDVLRQILEMPDVDADLRYQVNDLMRKIKGRSGLRRTAIQEDRIFKTGISAGLFMINLHFGVGTFSSPIADIESHFASGIRVYFTDGSSEILSLSHLLIVTGVTLEYLLTDNLGLALDYTPHIISQSSSFGGNVEDKTGNLIVGHAFTAQAFLHFVRHGMIDPFLCTGAGVMVGTLTATPVFLQIPGAPSYPNQSSVSGPTVSFGAGINVHGDRYCLWGSYGILLRFDYTWLTTNPQIYTSGTTFGMFNFRVEGSASFKIR